MTGKLAEIFKMGKNEKTTWCNNYTMRLRWHGGKPKFLGSNHHNGNAIFKRECEAFRDTFPPDARFKAESPALPEKKNLPTHPFQLALHWKQQIAEDAKLNQARNAAREGLSRARVTKVMNLLRLPEQIQTELQNLPPPLQIHSFSERQLRRLISIEDGGNQLRDCLELLQKLRNAGGE